MTKNRLEAFSDGVIAIIITIMVLELKAPHHAAWDELYELRHTFLSYVLSFVFVGIYWNNHHHLLHAAKAVDGRVLWANMHLLFWMSMIPFATAWMGETEFGSAPVALYGSVLLLAGLAYYLLARVLIRLHGADSVLAQAIGSDVKGLRSLAIYVVAIGMAFVAPWFSCLLYVTVAVMWLVPDRRITKRLSSEHDADES